MRLKFAIVICGLAIAAFANWRGSFDDNYFAKQEVADDWVTIPGLVSHWKMNDNAASKTLIDSKGSNNATIWTNTSLLTIAGKINGAITNNEVAAQYAYLTSFTGIPVTTNAFSLACWFYFLRSTAAKELDLIYFKKTADKANMLIVYQNKLYHANDNNDLQGNSTLTTNTWYHVAVTWDKTQRVMYVNGVVDGTKVGAMNSWGDPIENFYIFARWDFYANLQGGMDDVRVYNRALTSNEVFRIWNNGIGTERE